MKRMNRKGVLTAETAVVMPIIAGMAVMAAGLFLGSAVRARNTAQAALLAYQAGKDGPTEAASAPPIGFIIERREGSERSEEVVTVWKKAPFCLFLPGTPEVRVEWTRSRFNPVARVRQIDTAIRLAGSVFGKIGKDEPEQEEAMENTPDGP